MWTSIKMGGLVEAPTSLTAHMWSRRASEKKEKKGRKKQQINDGRRTRAQSADANAMGGKVSAC